MSVAVSAPICPSSLGRPFVPCLLLCVGVSCVPGVQNVPEMRKSNSGSSVFRCFAILSSSANLTELLFLHSRI